MKKDQTYEIIDNFLDQKSFDRIKSHFFSTNPGQFLWYYNKGIVRNPDLGPTGYEENDWMCSHPFIKENNPKVSDFLFLIDPIIKKLDAYKIIDARSILLTPTKNRIHHESHVDRKTFHKVALFYVTTSNGYTVLDNVTEVDCVENRMLIFDGSMYHHSASSTDDVRCAININFIPYQKIGNFKFTY